MKKGSSSMSTFLNEQLICMVSPREIPSEIFLYIFFISVSLDSDAVLSTIIGLSGATVR